MSDSFTLITGASSGIGEALAEQFAREGHDLILVARRAEKLEALSQVLTSTYDVRVEVIAQDLAAADGPEALYEKVKAAGFDVSILVNNAGIADTGDYVTRPMDEIMALININVIGLAKLSRLFGADMVDAGEGKILNVASVASFQPTPGFSHYGASKAFVLSLTEGMAEELRGTGVTITALCPGLVNTPLLDDAGALTASAKSAPPGLMLNADDVAKQGYDALMKGEVVHVTGLAYQAMTQFTRTQPKWLVRRLTGLSRYLGQ